MMLLEKRYVLHLLRAPQPLVECMDSSRYPVSGTLRPERTFLTRFLAGPVSPPAYRIIGPHETSMRGRDAEQ
jgi:hypothetical protein